MSRSHAGGLSKRCPCQPRAWLKCAHAWHAEFFCKKTAPIYGGKAKHRYSLDAVADARGVVAPRTKTDAAALADLVRSEIRSGTFRPPRAPEPLPTVDPTALTVGDVIRVYTERHVQTPTRRARSQQEIIWMLNVLRRTEIPAAHGTRIRFEMKPIKDVTTADLEAIRDARRAARAGTGTRRGGEVGCNRLLERCRHLFKWSIGAGYLTSTPFQLGTTVIVKMTQELPRDRRLVETGEDERLIACAGPHLRDLIIAAIATGARLGELLTLQWKDVRTRITPHGQTKQTVIFRAEKTKTSKRREIPVDGKLAAVLSMRRHAPDGVLHGPESFVFGNEVGEKVGSIKKAWTTCVLKAHGHTPTWLKGSRNHLTPESRAAYRQIDLHFHDLRREAASRLVESGATLVEASKLLGHSSVEQTATYLESTAMALESAIERKEAHEQQLADARRAAADSDNTPTMPNLLEEIANTFATAKVVTH